MEVVTRESYAHRLGIVGEDGEFSRRALAGLLRAPLERWGLSPRSAILRHVREQLEAAGVRDRASPMVVEVLDDLVRLGECVGGLWGSRTLRRASAAALDSDRTGCRIAARSCARTQGYCRTAWRQQP